MTDALEIGGYYLLAVFHWNEQCLRGPTDRSAAPTVRAFCTQLDFCNCAQQLPVTASFMTMEAKPV